MARSPTRRSTRSSRRPRMSSTTTTRRRSGGSSIGSPGSDGCLTRISSSSARSSSSSPGAEAACGAGRGDGPRPAPDTRLGQRSSVTDHEPLPAWSEPFADDVLDKLARRRPLEHITRDWAFGSGTGRGVTVGVIDSGMEADHPALAGRRRRGGRGRDRRRARRPSSGTSSATSSATGPRAARSSSASRPRSSSSRSGSSART